MMGRYSS